MKNRKKMVSFLAGIMAAVMLLTLILSLLPMPASALSSSEIRNQINALKKEKDKIKEEIKEVQAQYKENEDEIANIISRKNVIDQEIQLLHSELTNINEQISAYNTLIADKQDELDNAQDRYLTLNEENKIRVRAMEEQGSLSYWEVLFKANSFSDLLDRLNMVEEIAAADAKHLQEMSEAAAAVEVAQDELETEKADLEYVKAELDSTQNELDSKRQEADELIQELLEKADDLEALEEEFEQQEADFLKEIANMEVAFNEAKQREWEAYMATYVPPTQAPTVGGNTSSTGNTGNTGNTGGNTSSGGGGGWVWPTSARTISSPFGYRQAPTSGASTYHQGIDIDGNTGDAVWAAKAGVVIVSGWGSAAGNWVKIDHRDGFTSIYMHLNTRSVSVGQMVSAGQVIGTMGSTGVSTGDHLHFGITKNGVYVNPCGYV